MVGIFGAVVELTVFSIFVNLSVNVIYTNIISFHSAFVICFFLHYYYTYQKPYVGIYKVAGGFLKYFGLMYAQLIIGTLLIWLLIYKFELMPEVAKIIQIGIVTPVSYAVQKLSIFRTIREI